jgi:ribosomal protein S18 acetylase RimI-like enzyme
MSDDTITFRAARAADLCAIVALLADDEIGRLREDPGPPPAPQYSSAFQAIEKDPNQFLAVAVDAQDRVLGTLQITFLPGLSRKGAWRGQIESVRIAKSHRGTGLGKDFFDWAVGQCRARGCSLVQLTTDKSRPEAHRFYEKLGFVASHIGYKRALS